MVMAPHASMIHIAGSGIDAVAVLPPAEIIVPNRRRQKS
jgi:hypothetical protein